MNKEEQLVLKRIVDLAYQADRRGYTTYTDFLNINEQSIFLTNLKELPPVKYQMWGGYEDAERKIIGFYTNDTILTEEYDIKMLEMKPVNAKFADQLSHRDYLGALMNMGIERCRLGDILIKNNCGYVFTDAVIGEYIASSLTKIKHTTVSCTLKEIEEIDVTPEFQEIHGTIASARLDAIIATVFKASRSSITGLISGGKVFVNSKLIESNSYTLREEDVVSVRGYGKFIFKGINNQTKKGRLSATFLKYI
ncbi:MAG: YlmH/Sll1252 family protein [bacterium]|nr:YlmH/Sll1252 family protein [bacterium]